MWCVNSLNNKYVQLEKILQKEIVGERNMLINHGASDNNVENSDANGARFMYVSWLLSFSHLLDAVSID